MKGPVNKLGFRALAAMLGILLGTSFAMAQSDYASAKIWRGSKGISRTLREIMAQPPQSESSMLFDLNEDTNTLRQYLLSSTESQVKKPLKSQGSTALAPQVAGVSFDAVRRSEASTSPPDIAGGVGPEQILVCVSGRIRVFDKFGARGPLDTTTDTFFESVRGNYGTRNARVRFDRLTGRWFIAMTTTAPNSNRILLAISDGSSLRETTVFTFYQFQQDLVGTTPNTDTGRVVTSLSMGIDANAIYFGTNVFTNVFAGSTAFVVKKNSVLSGGAIEVTAFRNLTGSPTGRGLYTPIGVDNGDPAATEGYFIGVDNGLFGVLVVRTVSDPGGNPTLSADKYVYVPQTTYPMPVPALGSITRLSAMDDRLLEARLYKNLINGENTIWTAHAMQVNSAGVASNGGGRNGVRWYQIGALSTVPGMYQSGTIWDSASTNPKSYWMPTAALTTQGHLAIGMNEASPTSYVGFAGAGRLRLDGIGVSQPPTTMAVGSASYNVDSFQPQRWGSYSSTCVDPADGMTAWTFQQYVDAQDSWAVRVTQLKAPPPPVLQLTPSSLRKGLTADVQISGTVVNGTEFFDPGQDYPNHVSVNVDGVGVTINSISYISPTQIRINLTLAIDAQAGPRTITVVNPDGQTSTAPFTVENPTPIIDSISPISRPTGSAASQVTLLGNNFFTDSYVTVDGIRFPTTYVSITELRFTLNEADLAVGAEKSVQVVTPDPNGAQSNTRTFTVINPQPTMTDIAPTSVEVGASDFELTINGTGFVPNSVARWNGVDMPTTYVSPTRVTATVTASQVVNAGTALVRVFNPAPGGGGSTNDKTFTITNPVPTITDFTPASVEKGSPAITLTVNGTNFVPASKVRIAGIDRPTTFVSSTQLTAEIPETEFLTGGSRSVRVVSPSPGGGTAGPLFLLVNNPVPELTSIDPTGVAAGSGSFTLTVSGNRFVTGAIIRWNGLDRATVVTSETSASCTIPFTFLLGGSYANITIWNPGPAGGSSNAIQFSVFHPIPTITSTSPNVGQQYGSGFVITVNGSNFVSGATVKWNGSDRPTTFVSQSKLTAQIQDGDLDIGGSNSVTIRNPEPTTGDSNVATFTVNFAAPVIESVFPEQIPVGTENVQISVFGSYFAPTSIVRFESSDLATTYASSNELTAIVPAANLATGKLANITVFTPAPGGGISSPVVLTILNPNPALVQINPFAVNAGGSGFSLSVIGSNFVSTSEVLFNGQPRPTTYVSGTVLQASISAADLLMSGSASIRVRNPGPGGGTTPFISLGINNPVPRLDSISPGYANVGSSGLVVTLRGSGFSGTSVGTFKGVGKPTTFVSDTELRVTLSASDLSVFGLATMRVSNPTPGGGLSDFTYFSVIPTGAVTILPDEIVVIQGFTLTGDLAELAGSDNQYLGIFNDDLTLAAEVMIRGTSPITTPSQLIFEYEYAVARVGLVQQVDVYNYFGARWQRINSNVAPTSDVFLQLSLPGPSQFVGPAAKVSAKFLWQPINDEDPSTDGWVHYLDVVRWHVKP